MSDQKSIPITVFTGFLGAGKTSIILALLSSLPKDYRAVLLKNEYGDVEVDSKLAQQSSLTAVSEILNGCMCCVLVGQMQNALLEIREKYRPDRIFIECSGSAFPATLAFQIRELERETKGDLKLDAIITVIDAENFVGYEDTSPTAKMQASYSDVILINKWEHVSERQLDTVFDHLHTLNDLTPKIKCKGRAGVDPELIFGLDTQLFKDAGELSKDGGKALSDTTHNDEVETVTLASAAPQTLLSEQTLLSALDALSRETVWRVKGFVDLQDEGHNARKGPHILNWAFGRYDLTPTPGPLDMPVKLTVMGERGEVKRAARKLAGALGVQMC
ncbi:cobW-domain-containing protein [Schizophyllum amplum]|uniref:CobW-domain-containing protein n=1 Tax=Schizophyllum amplum TaxID=97359 RepID=A0A550CJN3_9AGAR|nr:cobW-domain-containing protein [Auriculariopsis ampla]